MWVASATPNHLCAPEYFLILEIPHSRAIIPNMSSDKLLAYAYLACFVAFILLRGAFALRRPPDSNSQTQLESRTSHTVRTILIVIQTALMACYGFRIMFGLFTWMDLFTFPMPTELRWVALAASVLALLGIAWVHATLGRHFSDRLNLQDEHKLVTDGPYRWVRHPMYSFLFLFFIESALLSANTLIAACSILLIANIWVRIKHEEQMLRDHFGPAFDEYAAKTPRLLPGVL